MSDFLKTVEEIGLLPLVVLEDASDAIDLGRALVKGGIPIAEVTFRTAAAADVIKQMSSHVEGLIVGAGTVHSVEQAKLAVECGATFIVTPGIHPDVVNWCNQNNVPVVPGCVTPSDIELALSLGLNTLKFFPAETYGGVNTLKSLAGPYKNVKFVPTGGVNENNLLDYLSQSNVAAVGGSFVIPNNQLKNKDWNAISLTCQKYVHKVLGFHISHVGINSIDNTEAVSTVNSFADVFSLPIKEGNSSFFVGELFEIMKTPYYGKNGHISIDTIDMQRAYRFLEKKGIQFIDETKKYDDNGNLTIVYLKDEIGGFAVHLRQKS